MIQTHWLASLALFGQASWPGTHTPLHRQTYDEWTRYWSNLIRTFPGRASDITTLQPGQGYVPKGITWNDHREDITRILLGITGDGTENAVAFIRRGDDASAETEIGGEVKRNPRRDVLAVLLAEQLVRRDDWAGAAKALSDPKHDGKEPSYPFLKAAVLAHLGQTHPGERAELVALLSSESGVPEAEFRAFRSDRPRDIEAIGWLYGGFALFRRPNAIERSVLYAEHFLNFIKPEPLEVRDLAECLNYQRRYRETISLVTPYLRRRDRKWREILRPAFDSAQAELVLGKRKGSEEPGGPAPGPPEVPRLDPEREKSLVSGRQS